MRLAEFKDAIAFLNEGDDFLLTSHINSDGDAIGACLGMRRLLEGLGKSARIVLQDIPEDHYEFLVGFEDIVTASEAPVQAASFAIFLDCPAVDRIGSVQGFIDAETRILNVDHHKDNSHFGDVNLVSGDVCSTSELLYHLARDMDAEIDAALAEHLYTGIVYDTGGFRYSLTTPTSMETAADLVRRGARLDFIADRIYNNNSLASVKLIGHAIEALEVHYEGRVAYLHLSNRDIQAGDPEEAVNYGLMIRSVEVAVLLKEEQPKRYRISLRSRDAVDVSVIAGHFGGGGHERAAGCRLDGEEAEIKATVLAEIARHLVEAVA